MQILGPLESLVEQKRLQKPADIHFDPTKGSHKYLIPDIRLLFRPEQWQIN